MGACVLGSFEVIKYVFFLYRFYMKDTNPSFKLNGYFCKVPYYQPCSNDL